MINVTEQAAGEIKKLIEAQNLPESTSLRVGVNGGGCSGLSYTLNFENEKKENDRVYDSNDVTVYIDTKSFLFLNGTTVGYSDGPNGGGFTFDNPNATQCCSCGGH